MAPGPSPSALIADAQRFLEDPALRAAVRRHFAAGPAGDTVAALAMGIHPEDQMLRHSLGTNLGSGKHQDRPNIMIIQKIL